MWNYNNTMFFGQVQSQKFGSQKLDRFLKSFEYLLCSPRLQLFDPKYSKNSNIMKNHYNLNESFL